jgi:hypothetical protein
LEDVEDPVTPNRHGPVLEPETSPRVDDGDVG